MRGAFTFFVRAIQIEQSIVQPLHFSFRALEAINKCIHLDLPSCDELSEAMTLKVDVLQHLER